MLEAVDAALAVATPQIWNSDQGSHVTSPQYTQRLEAAGVRISMDGKGRTLDNIFTERLWRSVKYEEVSLYDYASGRRTPGHRAVYGALQWAAPPSGAGLPDPGVGLFRAIARARRRLRRLA